MRDIRKPYSFDIYAYRSDHLYVMLPVIDLEI